MKVFAKFCKVDAEQRMVYGYASTEALDSDGERVMKAAIEDALPDYLKYSNIREMHKNSAVGIAKDVAVDEKGLYIAAKVVDDQAWEKVKEGVYKGFSIGGKTLAKDGNVITKLRLSEISIVDRPANPDAVFDVWKAADSKPTRSAEDDKAIDSLASLIDSKQVSIGDVLAAAQKLAKKDDKPAASATKDGVHEIACADKVTRFAKFANALAGDAIGLLAEAKSDEAFANLVKLARGEVTAKLEVTAASASTQVEADLLKVKCADEKERTAKLPKLDDAKRTALSATLAKSNSDDIFAELTKLAGGEVVAATTEDAMAKCMYHVSELAGILDRLSSVMKSAEYERASEGDASTVPDQLRAALKVLGGVLVDMAGEEVGELTAGELPNVIALAEKVKGLSKAGARHSKDDLDRLKKINEHASQIIEHAKSMGLPDASKATQSTNLSKVETTVLEKMNKALGRLDGIAAELGTISKRVKAIEDQPAPAKGQPRVVEKGKDGATTEAPEQVDPVTDDFGKVNSPATVLKAIHGQGPRKFLR
jgi:phage head maturation protease